MNKLMKTRYDFFICHASEDKDVARELATQLSFIGAHVWYDEFVLTIGDSLREKIDYGLASAKYGIVILSLDFFQKEWTKRELNGLVAREIEEKRPLILPLYHGITIDKVRQFSPPLADKVFVSTSSGMNTVVKEILREFAIGKMAFIDWTKGGRSLGEYLERHSYTHTLEVEGKKESIEQFLLALGRKYRIYDLLKQHVEKKCKITFDTGGCMEKEELADLANRHGLEVIENHFVMNGI